MCFIGFFVFLSISYVFICFFISFYRFFSVFICSESNLFSSVLSVLIYSDLFLSVSSVFIGFYLFASVFIRLQCF